MNAGGCAGSIGVGAGLGGVVVSKPGEESFVLGGLCNNGVGCVGGVEPCAMTETGQINKEKAIFHTVRIRTRGVGRSATLRFQPGR